MKAITLNRFLTVLAGAGIYVAGYLTLSHIMGKAIPCGASGGCAAIFAHSSSKIGPVPVAALGLGAYFVLFALAIIRDVLGKPDHPALSKLGTVISGAGAVISIGYTLFAIMVINQTCLWCLASLGIMVTTFVAYLILLSVESSPETTPAFNPMIPGIVAVLALGGIGVGASQLSHAGDYPKAANEVIRTVKAEDFLIDPKTQFKGNADAKVTLVEFADYFCPACRTQLPEIQGAFKQYNGRLRLGFSPFPLFNKEGHELSLPATVAALVAGEHGKFWEASELLFATPTEQMTSLDDITNLMESIGIDKKEVMDKIDKGTSYTDKLAKSMDFASSKGIDRTPTYIIFAEGQPPQMVSKDVPTVLAQSPYKELLAP